MSLKHHLIALCAVASVAAAGYTASSQHSAAVAVSASSRVEVAFSPDGGAENLVLRVIDSAHHQLRLAAYSFTSAKVVAALLAAKRRGVDVAVVVDHKNNIEDDRYGKARAALSALVNAGIPVRTVAVFPLHHDKFILGDSVTVQTGSFNYSGAAASRNSENVLVLWNAPDVAAVYLTHWEDRFARGTQYVSR